MHVSIAFPQICSNIANNGNKNDKKISYPYFSDDLALEKGELKDHVDAFCFRALC